MSYGCSDNDECPGNAPDGLVLRSLSLEAVPYITALGGTQSFSMEFPDGESYDFPVLVDVLENMEVTNISPGQFTIRAISETGPRGASVAVRDASSGKLLDRFKLVIKPVNNLVLSPFKTGEFLSWGSRALDVTKVLEICHLGSNYSGRASNHVRSGRASGNNSHARNETPANTGTPLTPGSLVMLQMHYHPTGFEHEADQTEVKLRMTETKPEQTFLFVAVGNAGTAPNLFPVKTTPVHHDFSSRPTSTSTLKPWNSPSMLRASLANKSRSSLSASSPGKPAV